MHLLDLRDREAPTNKVLLGISQCHRLLLTPTSRSYSQLTLRFVLLHLVLLAFPKEYMQRRQALKQEGTSAHAGECDLPLYMDQMALPGHTQRVNFQEAR